MSDKSPSGYTSEEILSYLPTGWQLEDPSDPGSWMASRPIWAVRVRDGADVDWTLEISADSIRRQGKLQALRSAADRVRRHGLA